MHAPRAAQVQSFLSNQIAAFIEDRPARSPHPKAGLPGAAEAKDRPVMLAGAAFSRVTQMAAGLPVLQTARANIVPIIVAYLWGRRTRQRSFADLDQAL